MPASPKEPRPCCPGRSGATGQRSRERSSDGVQAQPTGPGGHPGPVRFTRTDWTRPHTMNTIRGVVEIPRNSPSERPKRDGVPVSREGARAGTDFPCSKIKNP